MPNNPNQIDNIYEFLHGFFNNPRCKTAMLIISIMLTSVFVYQEANYGSTDSMRNVMTVIIGFWIGRQSKKEEKKEN